MRTQGFSNAALLSQGETLGATAEALQKCKHELDDLVQRHGALQVQRPSSRPHCSASSRSRSQPKEGAVHPGTHVAGSRVVESDSLYPRLFFNSALGRALFSPSLQLLDANDFYLASPAMDSVTQASDMASRRLRNDSLYDPDFALSLRLRDGQVILQHALLVSRSCVTQQPGKESGLRVRCFLFPSFEPDANVSRFYNVVETHRCSVTLPPKLSLAARNFFALNPLVEYVGHVEAIEFLFHCRDEDALRPQPLPSPQVDEPQIDPTTRVWHFAFAPRHAFQVSSSSIHFSNPLPARVVLPQR